MKLSRKIAPLALVFAVGAGASAQAQSDEQLADLIDEIEPATVSISTLKNVGEAEAKEVVPPGGPFPFLEEFNNDGTKAPQQRPFSLGSGFVIDAANCYVVTNNHVVDGGDGYKVTFPDGDELKADLVGTDPRTDLAVLKTECDVPLDKEVKWADSDQVRVGHDVIAIGNPQGLSNTVTHGIVSALKRDINAGPYDQFIQTDASINSGNSGGGLFNMDGEVVGVNTMIFSKSGGSVGLGFSVPSNVANHVTSQIILHGEVKRGWLGAKIEGLNKATASDLGLSAPRGALVSEVVENSPAEASGLQKGDVVLEFDGEDISSSRDLPRAVAFATAGEEVEVKVWRDGAEVTLNVTVGDLQAYEDRVKAEEEAKAKAEQEETAPVTPEAEGEAKPEETPTPEPETDIPPGFKIPEFQPG